MHQQEDDQRFFEENIYPMYGYLVKFVYSMCLDRELSKEIVQDVMMCCWQKIDKMREYEDLKHAVMATARNKMLDYFRKEKRRLHISDSYEISMMTGGEESQLLERLVQAENTETLAEMIGRLNPDYARVILWYYYYEMPLQDMAAMFKVNYNTIISRHRRALKQLAVMLEETELYRKPRKGNWKLQPERRNRRRHRAVPLED